MTHHIVKNIANFIAAKKNDVFQHLEIIEQCRKNRTQFTDPEFPPDESSLIRKMETPAKWRTYVWRRATEFMPVDRMKVFDDIHPNDILQGQLGDCYFLSCLSTLAERPKLIERLFLTEQANEVGCYAIWLNDNGEWKNFIIDDYFPCSAPNKGPVFSRGNGHELWVLLLEKAYAKLHGSFDIIEGGDPAWALRDLTGAPWDFLDSPDPNEVWRFVMESESRGYLITCYTKSTQIREEQNPLGIVFGHAYSILDAKEVVTDYGSERLIRIRNPWGKFEWKGDWGDESDKWTEKTKAQVNYENKDDGAFWMSVNDFVHYYEGVGICKLHENYLYKSISFDHHASGVNKSIFRLILSERTHIFLSVNQKDDRGFDANLHYEFSTVRIMIGRVDANGLHYVDGKFFNDRNVVIEENLDAGYYVITIEFYWRQQIHQAANISSYSDKKVNFEEILRADYNLIERNLIKSHILQSGAKKKPYSNLNADDIGKYSGSHLGMIYFYYNNQDTERQLHETVKVSKIENLKIMEPYTDPLEFTVDVMPQDDHLVLYKIIDERAGFALTPSSTSYVTEPSSREIAQNRERAYKGTTYFDDPTDKAEQSRDVSFYDDYIRDNQDIDPMTNVDNLANILTQKKAEIPVHPLLNPQRIGETLEIEQGETRHDAYGRNLNDQFRDKKDELDIRTSTVKPLQVYSLFDFKLWADFPKYVADDSRLGNWTIKDFEIGFSDVVTPIFENSLFDTIFVVLLFLLTGFVSIISLLRPQFVDIVLITSMISLIISRFSVFKIFQEINVALRIYPFLFIASCFLDVIWLLVYSGNWANNDITDNETQAGLKSFVIFLSFIHLLCKAFFSVLLGWKVISALKGRR